MSRFFGGGPHCEFNVAVTSTLVPQTGSELVPSDIRALLRETRCEI